jgi:hypothetical protein
MDSKQSHGEKMMANIRDAKPETDPDSGIPISSRLAAYKCDHCDNVHIVLCDEKGFVFAAAVLSDLMVLGIMDVFNNKVKEWPGPNFPEGQQ